MTSVLITGIGGNLAAMIAGALARQPGVQVVGVDRQLPDRPLPGVELQRAEMRGHSLRELLHATSAEVVIHLAQLGEERPITDREQAVQGNLLATMDLLGACVATGVRRVALRSSTFVYGARHDLPAFVRETTPLHTSGRAGVPIEDYVEIERFAADFGRKHTSLAIVSLRCAGLVGAGISSPLGRYLRQRAPRTMLGFDPRIQVLHPNDAAVAFALAALTEGIAGPFNIAASPTLTLGQAIRLAGRQPLPIPGPMLNAAGSFGADLLAGTLPFDPDFLRYACVADTQRANDLLGWAPQYSADEALRELAPQPALTHS